MESWTPREAARNATTYFFLALAVITVLELLFYNAASGLGEAIVRSLPLAIGLTGGIASAHLARWHYERKAA